MSFEIVGGVLIVVVVLVGSWRAYWEKPSPTAVLTLSPRDMDAAGVKYTTAKTCEPPEPNHIVVTLADDQGRTSNDWLSSRIGRGLVFGLGFFVLAAMAIVVDVGSHRLFGRWAPTVLGVAGGLAAVGLVWWQIRRVARQPNAAVVTLCHHRGDILTLASDFKVAQVTKYACFDVCQACRALVPPRRLRHTSSSCFGFAATTAPSFTPRRST